MSDLAEMDERHFSPSGVETTGNLIPYDSTNLTPDILRKAEEELGETAAVKLESLKQLRRMINGERDFRPLMDDAFFLRFLRSRKFDVESAFKTLKNYYTFKVRYARVITDFRPSELKHVYDMNIFSIMPYRDEEGSLIGVGRVAHWTSTDVVNVNDLFAAVVTYAEHVLQSEMTQICGSILVLDLKGLSLKLVRHLASPALIYRVVRALQDCVPARVKAIHYVNEPFYFSIIFNIIRPLLSEKIKNRVQFHGSNLAKLHKQIPPELLPKELNGKLGNMDCRPFMKTFLERDSYFEKICKFGYQEKRAQFIRKKSSMAFGLFL